MSEMISSKPLSKLIVILSIVNILMCCFTSSSRAQKTPISNSSISTWEKLTAYDISSNGKYLWYTYSSPLEGATIVFATTDGRYRRFFKNVSRASFTSNDYYLIFKKEDSLFIFNTKDYSIRYVNGVSNYVIPKNGNGRWLLYKTQENLVLKDLFSNQIVQYAPNAVGLFNDNGTALVLKTDTTLQWVDLSKKSELYICKGMKIGKVVFNHKGDQIIFFVQIGGGAFSMHSYKYGSKMSSVLASGNEQEIKGKKIILGDWAEFSRDDSRVFFKLKDMDFVVRHDPMINKLRIWHYRDIYYLRRPNNFTATMPSSGGAILQLENKDSILIGELGNKYALISRVYCLDETHRDTSTYPFYQLISLETGDKRNFIRNSNKAHDIRISPDERFVGWVDTLTQQYYCYEIAVDSVRCLTNNIFLPIDSKLGRRIDLRFYLSGWIADDAAILLQDRYDIWQVDPRGKRIPINITGHYGRKHKISYRVALDESTISKLRIRDHILLCGMEDTTSFNGIFEAKLSIEKMPQTLIPLERAVYYYPGLPSFSTSVLYPLKASKAPIYVYQRQSATSSPNIVVQIGTNPPRVLSNINPEARYKWFTSELHHWNNRNGETRYGILYKPDDFSKEKKYPVIFHYYDILSKGCNMFRDPMLGGGTLDVAWYVSNGYIVFVPDIWANTGYTGLGALETVEGAAEYLIENYDWVNKEKMGLQGHSFGGYITNYIAMNSKMFAAAQSSSGLSDLIREYGDISFGGMSLTAMCEVGQLDLGWDLWQRSDIYVNNSPIFSAEKCTTPLLLMHGDNDEAVPYGQSQSLFLALRRLNKPVWLLQYKGEGHGLTSIGCVKDFEIRQQQFFNYYLKDSLPPAWLSESILDGLKSNVTSRQSPTSGVLNN